MRFHCPARAWFTVATVLALYVTSFGQEQSAVKPETQTMASVHDGQHDFDFLFGRWKVHCRRLVHPLSGSTEWIEFDGVNTVHRVWDGKANLDEFEAETPSGHVEGMTIRTYSTKSRQWSIYWSSQANYNGKWIFVRFTWVASSPDSCHWEQAFSADGGKTWETNFIWDLKRGKT